MSMHPEAPYWNGLATTAMVYAWPLYEMQRMRAATAPRQLPGLGFAGDSAVSTLRWCNAYSHSRQLLKAGGSRVVMPNNDTLYSSAWLNLTQGPVVLSVPAMGDRYHVLGLLDYYTNPFGHIGTRTTGQHAVAVLLTPPGWVGDLPVAFGRPGCHLRAPTPWVWVIARLLVENPTDAAAVHALQDAMIIQTLDDWQAGRATVPSRFDARFDLRAPLDAETFLRQVNDALLENPPPPDEAAMLRPWREMGLAPGATVPDRPVIRAAWDAALSSIYPLLDLPGNRFRRDDPGRGWSSFVSQLGSSFEGDYLLRALVARQAIGALSSDEAIYPRCDSDADGVPLDGRHAYRLRFAPGEEPPVNAFWSLSLYDHADKMFVPNPIDRYAVGDRTQGLVRDADGGLTLYIQHEAPTDARALANWLPAPTGPFMLLMRAYLPRPQWASGAYRLPLPVRARRRASVRAGWREIAGPTTDCNSTSRQKLNHMI